LFSDQTFIFIFLKTLFELVGFRYMGMICHVIRSRIAL